MAGYIKTDGNDYSKAAAPGVQQPWNPNVPKTPDELPTFAAGDAGKVLAVNEDGDGLEWAEAGGGGGGGAGRMIVTITESDGEYAADKPFAEILAALNAGDDVVARYDEQGYIYNFVPSVWYGTADNGEIDFTHLQWHYSGDGSQTSYWTINARALKIFDDEYVAQIDQYFQQS